MKNLIAIAALALALAGCNADPPAAPEVSAVPTNSQGTFKWPGDLITPSEKPGAPLFGSAVSDSCVARRDQTPCTLTNQEALIEILRLSQTNVLIQCYKPAASWQDMLLPPVKTGQCK